MKGVTRRDFMKSSLAVSAVLAVPFSRVRGANKDIRVAVVGIIIVVLYFLGGMPLLGRTVLKKFRQEMSPCRFYVMSFLFLTMGGLIIKMFLRWTINLKYVVFIPDYFFNI